MIHKIPRDFGEVAAIEILAAAMSSQSADGEFWELRPADERNRYREAAYEMLDEALRFWSGAGA